MASAIVFRSPFVPIAPRGLARPGQPRRSPHHLISGVVYRGKRLGNDSERVYVTFKPSDDSNAPGSTPTPEAVPAGDGGQQPAAASGPAARRSGGFPLPLEKGSGHDFWGGGGAGKAPAEEDVVQIPIEGIPDKAPTQQAHASASDSVETPAAVHDALTEDTLSASAHTAPANEPEAAEVATAAAALAAFADEDTAEDAKATDWDGDDGGYESDGLGAVSEEEHTDRGWGVYGPIAAAIDAGRKAREAVDGASSEQPLFAGVASTTPAQEVVGEDELRINGSADGFRAYADSVKASGGREEDAMFAKWASLPAAERDAYLRRAEDLTRPDYAVEPPTDELMDAARQELSRGWKFIKDAAGEWDARAADALTEAGAIVAASLSSVDEEVTAALTGVFNGLDEAVPGGIPRGHGVAIEQASKDGEGVREPIADNSTPVPAAIGHKDEPEHVEAAAEEEASAEDGDNDEDEASALYEELVHGPMGIRELEAKMVDLGFDMDSMDVFFAEDQVPDRWPRPLDDLKDHLQFVHSFIDDHINVNKFWDDNRMYEAITDDNGDEHELDTPLSLRGSVELMQRHWRHHLNMSLKDELALMWDKLDVMTKYPVSVQAARPDDAEEEAESEEEDASDDADDQDEVETMGTMVADLGERLQQLDQQVVALDARVGTVPYQDGRQDEVLAPWLDKVDRQVGGLQGWLEDISNEHEEVKQEFHDALDERVTPLEKTCAGIVDSASSLRGSLDSLSKRVDALEQVHDDEHDQEDDANDDYNELEARLSVLEDHREEIDDRFNEDADGELEERVSALEELEERVSGLEAFRQKAYREIANASVSDSHNDDDEELEGRVSALEDDCKACMTHVADIARAVNGLHGDDDYEERVSKLEADREIAAARLDNSVRRFAQADADQRATIQRHTDAAQAQTRAVRAEFATHIARLERRMDKSQVWVEELIEAAQAKQGGELDSKVDAQVATKLQEALDAGTGTVQLSASELKQFRLSAIAAGHAFKQQTAMAEAQAAQVAKLQQEVAALREFAGPPPPTSPAGAVWRLILGVAAIAARAAAAATGALAVLYAAVALPGVRNALHRALAAEPGTVRLPVLAVLGVAAFVATALSIAAGRAATVRSAV